MTGTLQVYLLSGGVGASGEQLARTVLAQFPDADVDIQIFPKVFSRKQIRQILQQALDEDAIVAHTFVDPILRKEVEKFSDQLNLIAVDLVGSLMELLANQLGQQPLGKPGLYRQLHKSYFDRIGAMDYTLDHDDGKNSQGWADAEIVLVGPSRVGKTPISLYLSVIGWKVANIPIVAGISLKKSFFDLDVRRIIGLTISPSELIEHRKHRQSRLGVGHSKSDYVTPEKVFGEIEALDEFLKHHDLPVIDVTGKPIETSADEVLRILKRRLKLPY